MWLCDSMMIKWKEPKTTNNKAKPETNKKFEAKMQVFAQAQQNWVEWAKKLLETFEKDKEEK